MNLTGLLRIRWKNLCGRVLYQYKGLLLHCGEMEASLSLPLPLMEALGLEPRTLCRPVHALPLSYTLPPAYLFFNHSKTQIFFLQTFWWYRPVMNLTFKSSYLNHGWTLVFTVCKYRVGAHYILKCGSVQCNAEKTSVCVIRNHFIRSVG